jgi:hypothetical protein
VAELARTYRFVPFEEVVGTQVHKAVPINAEIRLHSGVTVTMKESYTGDTVGDSRDTLTEVLSKLGERAIRA